MLLRNIKGYMTSKSGDELLLTGDYTITNKKLNSRIKVIDEVGKVFWVPEEFLHKSHYEKPIITLQSKESEQRESSKTSLNNIVEMFHVVKRGETLQSIANLYNVEPSTLVALNGAKGINIGSTILIRKEV